MKRMRTRGLALLVLCSLLLTPALAAEGNQSFQELRPPTPFEIGPQWTELDVTIQSGENTLRGTLTAPREIDGKLPVAILLHGLNTDRNWCADIAWCLADHGIASVRFDFSGHGLSDGAQEDMTIARETSDVLAMLDYVEELRFTDPDNIFLIGKSLGGVAATLATESRGDEIRAMCLWYPGFGVTATTHFGFFLGEMYAPWDPPETLEIAGYTYGKAFLEEAAALDLTEPMQNYDRPVLIIHGDRDFIAPVVFSFGAANIFPDCTLEVVPGGFHGFLLFQEMIALEHTLAFLQENMA